MNRCVGKISVFVTLLHKLRMNPILLKKSRIRTIYLSRTFCTHQSNKPNKETGKVMFERAFEPLAQEIKIKNRNSLYYLSAFILLVSGLTYMSVLLYRLYCQTTGKGGQAVLEEAGEKVASMKAVKNRKITVHFNADINSSIMWNFKPQQPYIQLLPGETVLAFYTAMNPTNRPVTGVATYNVVPFEAGKYLNKIQCFCFEEQQLNPQEEVDMPVFFYIDPEYADDPFLENIHDIVLSYTFFEAKEGLQLPMPAFLQGN